MINRRDVVLRLLGAVGGIGSSARLDSNENVVYRQRKFSVPLVDDQGKVQFRYDASARYFVEELGGGVNLEMAVIPGGGFVMGSTAPAQPGQLSEQPMRRVQVRPFALGVFPVTRAQWRQVSTYPQATTPIRGYPNSQDAELLPVDAVIYWAETEEFCERLRQRTGRPYRVPSEAEWEYACRAGTTTKYHFGDGISRDVANYNDGIFRPSALSPVGSKNAPNRFGLHDMHGNVLETCGDWMHPTYEGAPTDGRAWTSGGNSMSRVCRGGSYLFNVDTARSSYRSAWSVFVSFSGKGLRVACDVALESLDPKINANGAVNSASGVFGPVAPGEIITIRGENIGPAAPMSARLDERGYVATEISSTRVLFDGIPGAVLFVSAEQINAVVPYELSSQSSVQVMVERDGQSSAPISMVLSESAPGLFTADSSGRGQAAALNQDGSYNAVGTPARKGEIITVFGTGEGRTNPPGETGKLAEAPFARPVLPVECTIGGVSAEIRYVGSAPGLVAGLLQVNVVVPQEVQSGAQSIVLRVGRQTSQAGVFVAIA